MPLSSVLSGLMKDAVLSVIPFVGGKMVVSPMTNFLHHLSINQWAVMADD